MFQYKHGTCEIWDTLIPKVILMQYLGHTPTKELCIVYQIELGVLEFCLLNLASLSLGQFFFLLSSSCSGDSEPQSGKALIPCPFCRSGNSPREEKGFVQMHGITVNSEDLDKLHDFFVKSAHFLSLCMWHCAGARE